MGGTDAPESRGVDGGPAGPLAVIGGGGSGFLSGTVDGPLPRGVVPTVAHVARMYDYLLGRYFA